MWLLVLVPLRMPELLLGQGLGQGCVTSRGGGFGAEPLLTAARSGRITPLAGLRALGPERGAFKHRLLPPTPRFGGRGSSGIEEKGNIPCENLDILLPSFCRDWLVLT